MAEFKERLSEYRIQSWQIEMLIAGGVIFSLYTVDDTFRSSFLRLYTKNFTDSNHVLLLFALYMVTRILILGFTANLILRSVWLAYLGITFSFPKGINYRNLRSSEAYKNLLKSRPSTINRVNALERWCNLSYSMAVLLALFTASLLISLSVVVYILNFFDWFRLNDHSILLYSLAMLFAVFQLGIFDKFMLRFGNKDTSGSRFRQRISKVFKYLTLSVLFERELLVLKTNMNKWALYSFALFFFCLSLLISSNQIGRYYPWGTLDLKILDERENYDTDYAPMMNSLRYAENLSEDVFSYRGCIQSEIVTDKHLKLFIVSWINFDYFLEKKFELHGYQKDFKNFNTTAQYVQFKKKNDSIYHVILNELFLVKIDSAEQKNLKWREYIHAKTREQGYLALIDIDSLKDGEHDLDIDVRYFQNDTIKTGNWLRFPFWKE